MDGRIQIGEGAVQATRIGISKECSQDSLCPQLESRRTVNELDRQRLTLDPARLLEHTGSGITSRRVIDPVLAGVRIEVISCAIAQTYAQNRVARVAWRGDLPGCPVERFQILAEKSFEVLPEVEESHLYLRQGLFIAVSRSVDVERIHAGPSTAGVENPAQGLDDVSAARLRLTCKHHVLWHHERCMAITPETSDTDARDPHWLLLAYPPMQAERSARNGTMSVNQRTFSRSEPAAPMPIVPRTVVSTRRRRTMAVP
ncbi:hypothetical protein BAY59_06915 [Prauserella coralliicola]|nr:hypothetical protein BAY59_06915 [Prauserella coralliicola]